VTYLREGLITKGVGGFYTAVSADGFAHTLRAQSKLRRQHLTPMVGDRVEFQPGAEGEEGWLVKILPRKNSLIRPPVANIDVALLVVAAASPDPDLVLLDRMLVAARQAGIKPIVAVNKADLAPEKASNILSAYRTAADRALLVSSKTGEGVSALREALAGSVHALSGQSGAGKSTLINALYGLTLVTGQVSRIERGRHTTRHSELIALPGGGMVLDTPGFSLLESELIEPIHLKDYYPEFRPCEGSCRFSPCAHASEPGCRVREAVANGEIDPGRHERYKLLFEEMTQRWKDRYD
jgi:ribosome biogenesis GTPase